MFIERVILKHWCQHAELDVQFGELTAVRGPNGVGKTNLINAVVYAFTGEVRNPGVKDANINQFAADDDESGVWVHFRHEGVKCELHRGLRPSRAYVVVNGTKTSGARQVTALLREILRVDENLIHDYVFVPQWGMFAFISQKDSDRAKAFAQLFGVERAEKIWELLRESRLPDASVTIDGAEVKKRLEKAENERQGAIDELNLADQEVVRLESGKDQREKIIRDYQSAERLRGNVSALERQCSEAVRAHNESARQLKDRNKEVNELKQQFEEGGKAAHKASEVLRDWGVYEAVQRTRRAFQADLERAGKKQKELKNTWPQQPENYIPAAERATGQAAHLKDLTELSALKRFIDSCDPEKGIAACPTCGTPTEQGDIAGRLAEAKQSVPVLEARTRAWREANDRSIDYDHQLVTWKAKDDAATDDLRRAQDNLTKAELPPRPEQSKEEAQRVIDEQGRLVNNLAAAQGARDEAFNKEAEDRARVEMLQGQLQTTRNELAALTPFSRAQFEAAVAEQHDRNNAEVKKGLACGKVENADESIKECRRLLAKFEEESRRHRTVEQLSRHLQDVREVFHRDRLPARVSQYYLNQIRGKVNDTLEQFEGPFRVISVEGLRFVVRFTDGRVVPAERLSGGEKVILALAFRLAVHSVFAAELGLLCLDEPTAGLDDNNMACLEVALSRLREVSKARSLQLVLITHEKGLDNLCDCMIDLAQ